MDAASEKNLWDLLAAVRQRLAAGETRVVFAWGPPPGATDPDGPYTRATDDQGTAYDIGGDHLALFEACRDAGISFQMSAYPGQPATLTFGHHLPWPVIPEGALLLDLTGHDVRVEERFNPDDPRTPRLHIEARPKDPADD